MLRVMALALTLLSLSAAPVTTDTMRIAHPPLPPFAFVKDGKTVGLVADILRAAAAREQINLVFIQMSYADLGKTLTNGTSDAVAPFPISTQANLSYDFTRAFVTTGGGLFVRAPNQEPSGLAALSGKTVVTPTFGPYVRFIQQNFPNVKVVPTSSYPESLDRVVSGQADAAALNMQEGAFVVAESYAGKVTVPQTAFEQLTLALAVAKGQHANILKRLDAGLAAISADGTLQRIEGKWNRPPK